ncbi:UNVERIFIED_ORG: hypothetical protein QOE_4559 [Clostridioides difficile F501]
MRASKNPPSKRPGLQVPRSRSPLIAVLIILPDIISATTLSYLYKE